MNWIDIRDYLPPKGLEVLFYVQDLVTRDTEDKMIQGCLLEESDDLNELSKFSIDIGSTQRITHWTLPPCRPTAASYG